MASVIATAMPAAPQPGGLATSAMPSGIEKSAARVRTFALLRPLINRATGLKSAFTEAALELFPVVVRVRQGELAGRGFDRGGRAKRRCDRERGDGHRLGRGFVGDAESAHGAHHRLRVLAHALRRGGRLL